MQVHSLLPRASRPPAAARGFTLIELMLAVVVIGILLAVALPAYRSHIMKGRRSDAISALSSLQQAQERWRANHPGYSSTLAELREPETSPKGYYRLAISEVNAAGYTISATAIEGKAQAADSACSPMTAKMNIGNLTYGPSTAGCWAK